MIPTLFSNDIKQTEIIVGKVIGLNKGENFSNVTLKLMDDQDINIKLNNDENNLELNKIYQFHVIKVLKKEVVILVNQKFSLIEDILPMTELYNIFVNFYPCSPINFAVTQQNIEFYLNKIQNQVVFDITKTLYEKNKKYFLLHPAAFKMHHNYYGGLSYHTANMLKMADLFIELFPYLRADFLYAGIILHDMAKVQEINAVNKRYTKQGILLGHLIMMNNEIVKTSLALNYHNKEEVLILQHIIVSHHGLLQFGAFKKPKIGEALLIWYLDSIDSQLTVLGEHLSKTSKGEFTENIPILNKNIFYKPNL